MTVDTDLDETPPPIDSRHMLTQQKLTFFTFFFSKIQLFFDTRVIFRAAAVSTLPIC